MYFIFIIANLLNTSSDNKFTGEDLCTKKYGEKNVLECTRYQTEGQQNLLNNDTGVVFPLSKNASLEGSSKSEVEQKTCMPVESHIADNLTVFNDGQTNNLHCYSIKDLSQDSSTNDDNNGTRKPLKRKSDCDESYEKKCKKTIGNFEKKSFYTIESADSKPESKIKRNFPETKTSSTYTEEVSLNSLQLEPNGSIASSNNITSDSYNNATSAYKINELDETYNNEIKQASNQKNYDNNCDSVDSHPDSNDLTTKTTFSNSQQQFIFECESLYSLIRQYVTNFCHFFNLNMDRRIFFEMLNSFKASYKNNKGRSEEILRTKLINNNLLKKIDLKNFLKGDGLLPLHLQSMFGFLKDQYSVKELLISLLSYQILLDPTYMQGILPFIFNYYVNDEKKGSKTKGEIDKFKGLLLRLNILCSAIDFVKSDTERDLKELVDEHLLRYCVIFLYKSNDVSKPKNGIQKWAREVETIKKGALWDSVPIKCMLYVYTGNIKMTINGFIRNLRSLMSDTSFVNDPTTLDFYKYLDNLRIVDAFLFSQFEYLIYTQ